MEKEKNNKGVIALLVVMIVVLGVLCVLFATDTINLSKNTKTNDTINNDGTNNNTVEENKNSENVIENTDNNTNNNTNQETTIKYFYNVNELKVKALPESQVFADISKNTNVVEKVDFRDYAAVLDLSGNVTVQKYSKSENDKGNTGKLNVSNVIDIVQFNIPSMDADQLLYLLTDSGNVYYYRIGDIEKNSFNATKVESVSNVKKIFISYYSKANAGSSWALFAITSNNDCIMLKGESV